MQTFSFKILLPDGKAFEDKIVSLLVRALDGEWGIRAGHAPAAAVLAEAVAVAEKEDGSTPAADDAPRVHPARS